MAVSARDVARQLGDGNCQQPGGGLSSLAAVSFERLACVSEIPEECGLSVRRGELEIGLYRVEGRVYAMENVCPHAGYLLHEGELDGSYVVCPGHGWAFSVVTGLAPGEVEEQPLRRYPVRIEGDEVWIDLETPLDP